MGKKSKTRSMPVTREMRELVAMLHKRYPLRELGKIAGVYHQALSAIEKGAQRRIATAHGEKIMGLSNMVTVEDRWKAE